MSNGLAGVFNPPSSPFPQAPGESPFSSSSQLQHRPA